MLKVVVFDSGFGGELFADYFEEEMPVVKIIRVIDWRNAEAYLNNPRLARKLAREALRPYIGRVDLIVLANHLLSITSLKYFQRKYRGQKFIGFGLKKPDSFVKRDVLVITTKAVTRTIKYQRFLICLRRRVATMTVDEWLGKIDDGELETGEIEDTMNLMRQRFKPGEIILVASQLNDIKRELWMMMGQNVKIYDCYRDTLKKAYRLLRIRGGGRKKK